MSGSDQAVAFERLLRPYQLRLRTAVFVGYFPGVLAILLLVASIFIAAFHPGVLGSVAACVVALVVATVGAGGWAVLRTPPLFDTARAVDRHFHLNDVTVTALQFASAPDPVSRLIVCDASRRLASLRVTMLPLGSAPPAVRLAAVVTAAFTVAVMVIGARQQTASDVRNDAVADTGVPGQPTATQPMARERSAVATSPTQQSLAVAPSGVTSVSRDDAPTSASVPRPVGAAGAPTTERAGEPAEGRVSSQPASSQPSSQRAAATPTTLSSSSAGSAAEGQASTGSGAGTRGGQSPARRTTSAGGVGGGDVMNTGGARSVTPLKEPGRLPDGGATASRDGAIGVQRVPPRLRGYVRDYFVAIGRPTRQ